MRTGVRENTIYCYCHSRLRTRMPSPAAALKLHCQIACLSLLTFGHCTLNYAAAPHLMELSPRYRVNFSRCQVTHSQLVFPPQWCELLPDKGQLRAEVY